MVGIDHGVRLDEKIIVRKFVRRRRLCGPGRKAEGLRRVDDLRGRSRIEARYRRRGHAILVHLFVGRVEKKAFRNDRATECATHCFFFEIGQRKRPAIELVSDQAFVAIGEIGGAVKFITAALRDGIDLRTHEASVACVVGCRAHRERFERVHRHHVALGSGVIRIQAERIGCAHAVDLNTVKTVAHAVDRDRTILRVAIVTDARIETG